jgi:hypothetical protein
MIIPRPKCQIQGLKNVKKNIRLKKDQINIQGVVEMRVQILTTSYWLHVELGKKYFKNAMLKNKITLIF